MKKELYERLAMDFFTDEHENWASLPVGLVEEANEVLVADTTENLKEELGDVLWYVTAMAHKQGWTLSDIMANNYHKLERRAAFGKV
jgi:NTP pyrophosphatase (non-canonical NTP hydrolase)